jgi:hypothetical protein
MKLLSEPFPSQQQTCRTNSVHRPGGGALDPAHRRRRHPLNHHRVCCGNGSVTPTFACCSAEAADGIAAASVRPGQSTTRDANLSRGPWGRPEPTTRLKVQRDHPLRKENSPHATVAAYQRRGPARLPELERGELEKGVRNRSDAVSNRFLTHSLPFTASASSARSIPSPADEQPHREPLPE